MQDLTLLQAGTIAPVGNLRLKESVEMIAGQQVNALEQMRFEQQQVIERNHDFLNYARQRGATGAGGAAPKLLVRLNPQREVWIDTLQNDNIAVLKHAAAVSLAPIYDFAPMKADPEVVMRTTHWSNTFERGGDIDWLGLCDHLACYGEPELFKTELRQLAAKLQHLPGRLTARGVPASIMQMPVMGFAYLETRLQKWGLLP